MLRYALILFSILTMIPLSACSPEEVKADNEQPSAIAPAAEETAEPEPTPIPYDQAKLKALSKEIAALDSAFSKAFTTKNLQLFMQTEGQGEALVKRLEAIEYIRHPAHQASECYSAAVYLTTNRGIAWVTLNSNAATETDKRIDRDNLAETAEAIKACNAAAQAGAKK